MTFVNSILQAIVNGLLYPFRQFPIVALVLISILTAVGLLLVFKKTSNQTALEAVKRRIHASLFEIRLFNDDLGAIFRAQFEILRTNLVKVELAESLSGEGAAKPEAVLEVPAGLRLETPAVWIPSRGELAWRMMAEQEGGFSEERTSKRAEATEEAAPADAEEAEEAPEAEAAAEEEAPEAEADSEEEAPEAEATAEEAESEATAEEAAEPAAEEPVEEVAEAAAEEPAEEPADEEASTEEEAKAEPEG